MERNDKAEELMKSMAQVESLEEVPTEVSARFHETLSRLASQGSKKTSLMSRLTGANQFALAASFVLVFALGIVVNFGTFGDPSSQMESNKTTQSESSSESNLKDDQIQYSGGSSANPEKTDLLIKLSNSSHDYSEIPLNFSKEIGAKNTWNSIVGLDKKNVDCLKKLELVDSTNLIDIGVLDGKAIKAIWTPVTRTSWNVYLIDSLCNAIEKKYVQD